MVADDGNTSMLQDDPPVNIIAQRFDASSIESFRSPARKITVPVLASA